jgi:hypothetical protein
VTCPTCGTESRPGAKFCAECATPLAPTCPSCGTANAPGAKFCAECATPLAPGAQAAVIQPCARSAGLAAARPGLAKPDATAERRLVSVQRTYALVIKGVSGSLSHTASASLSVTR